MNKKSDMPCLDPANYGPWLLALRATATANECLDHFKSNPTRPQNADGTKDFDKKQNFLLGKIIATIPPEIANLLITPTSDPTPYDLIQQIKQHLDNTNANDHKCLKQEAEEAHFLPGPSIQDYVEQHENIRARMIAAQYPNITDGKTTVEFMIDGLKHSPYTAPIGLQLIALDPVDVKGFVHKFKRISSYQSATHTIPIPHTLPPAPGGASHNPSGDNYPNRPRRGPPRNRRRNPNFKPCKFHLQRGIPHPQHTDEECNDPDHPKHNNDGRQDPRVRFAMYDEPAQYHHHNIPKDSSGEDTAGTFILDTATDPTHTTQPSSQMTPLTKPIDTITATNDRRKCTHAGQTTIRTNKDIPLTLPAVSNPAVKQNLLSVHDIATRYGNVLFTPARAIIYNKNHHSLNHNQVLGTAPWNPHLRAYSWSNHPPLSSKAARTIPSLQPQTDKTNTPRPNLAPTSNNHAHTSPSQSRRPTPTPTRKHNVVRISHQHVPHHPHQKPPNAAQMAFYDWHLRLNHAPTRTLQQMALLNTLSDMPSQLRHTPPKISCSSCVHAKQRPAPHKRCPHHYPVGTYISSDTCGPITPISRHGHAHFLTFIDASSRFLFLYFLKNRKEVSTVIPAFLALLKNRYGKQPAIYRTDNAKEFQSKAMNTTYQTNGTEYRHNTPYQPQENSLAERINQTLMNAARAALHHANLDDTFWENAVRDVAYKYNFMIHSAHQKSPYEMWTGRVPKSTQLLNFGQCGTITVHSPKRKLQSRADPARYMYGISANLITVLNLRSQRYQQIRIADFRPYHPLRDPTRLYSHTLNPPQARLTHSTKRPRSPHREPTLTPTTITNSTPDPKTHHTARRYPDSHLWATAHDTELDQLDKTGTIRWIPDQQLPSNQQIIPLKMTYRYKRAEHGQTLSRKARCAVRGDTMKPGIHYNPENTTTYMAEKTSIRALLATAASNKWPIEHFDIKSAYLHEKYEHNRPVYVKQHPRFNGSFKHLCRAGQLIGNLYGTPPASQIYFTALAQHLKQSGFTQTEADPCMFIKITNATSTLIAVSMDDFLVVANTTALITQVYNSLKQKYDIKRLGIPSNYLNWNITQNQDGSIHIAQPHVVNAILSKTNMSSCNTKPSPSPDKINRDTVLDSPPLNNDYAQIFRSVVGDLRYLADSTRFDIYHITNRLAAGMHKPTTHHSHLLTWLLRYIRGTTSHGISYHRSSQQPPSHNSLQTFSDADFANSQNRKSYTGIVHTLHGSPISWTSNQQSTVALSTCEYVAATTATQQTNWLRRMLHDIHQTQSQPAPHHIDNNSAILIAKNTAPTKRRKLIDIRYHYLRDHIDKGLITITRIASTDNPADLFTKPLGNILFRKYTRQLNLLPPQTSSVGGTGD